MGFATLRWLNHPVTIQEPNSVLSFSKENTNNFFYKIKLCVCLKEIAHEKIEFFSGPNDIAMGPNH